MELIGKLLQLFVVNAPDLYTYPFYWSRVNEDGILDEVSGVFEPFHLHGREI
jgi:hypothetical protein